MKPSLELHAEIETAEGATFRWDANARRPEDRPSGINFSNKLMEGCANGGCVLPRKPGSEWPDLGLYDTLRFVTMAGEVVSEMRVARLAGDTDSEKARIGVLGGSWMSHARDRPMPPFLYRDADLSHWQQLEELRKLRSTFDTQTIGVNISSDGIVFALPSSAVDGSSIAEAVYIAPPGAKAISIEYNGTNVNVPGGYEAARFDFADVVSDLSSGTGTFERETATLDSTDRTATASAGKAFVATALYANTVGTTPSDGAKRYLSKASPIGDHGLTNQGDGFLVSDMIVHSANLYAPLLDTSGVQATTHIVEHAVEYGLIDPYDFWLRLNKYEMRNLAVRPGRLLTYEPFDTSVVNWRVRRGDPGTRIRFSGPDTERVVNGVIVSYQNVVTGRSTVITPDDEDRLRDDDPRIAANRHGIKAWEPIQLPDPDSEEGAIRFGELVLARMNRHRRPGKITVTGHVRDDAGNWHPAFKVRDGDTILVEDDEGNPEGEPLTVHEMSWSGDTKTATITVDAESQDADALLDQAITEKRTRRIT